MKPGRDAGGGGDGRWQGAGRTRSPYLTEEVGEDGVWQCAGEARELQGEQRELSAAAAGPCPGEPPGPGWWGGGGRALPTLAAAQSIQPLPLGSMFMRTSPSTRSGKMSCGEQGGRCSAGWGDAPRAAPHHHHCLGIAQGRCGPLLGVIGDLWQDHLATMAIALPPWSPGSPGAFTAARPAPGHPLLLFPMPRAASRYRQLRASPFQPQAHRKLGQHIGSCPNTDPDHVLEPGKRKSACGGDGGHQQGLSGDPSTSSMGHKTCRVPAYRDNSPNPNPLPPAHLPAQHPQPAAVEERLTHPKCCTTLGNMAASWSMDGYWYLQHREAGDGSCGTPAEQEGWGRAAGLPEAGREMPPTHCPPWASRLPRALSRPRGSHRQGLAAQAAATQRAGVASPWAQQAPNAGTYP